MRSSAETFRTAATAIADQIVEATREEGETVFWLTASARPDSPPDWIASPTLYNGVAGIASFLLEASHVLSDRRYQELALAGLKWAEAKADGRDHSFYSGRLGIAYTMLRAHELTGDSEWLEAALRLSRGCERFLEMCISPDVLYGSAGSILGLLHLREATGEAWIADALDVSLRRLLSLSHWTPQGITWCSDRENIRGLCGLSHGNAGVALALMEAGLQLDRPGLDTVAREAMRYENAFFDPVEGSWPDFRKLGHYDDERFAREYGQRPPEFFVEPGKFDSWCHGAPGIGLVRARAVELLGEEWRTDLQRALAKTETSVDSMQPDAFTLCHGICGNAFLFIEAARVSNDPACLVPAESVARKTLESRKRRGYYPSGYVKAGDREDFSLMMGNAGIGYFLLNLMEPNVPNPLLPRLRTAVAVAGERWTDGVVARHLVSAVLPRTMALIDRNAPEAAARFFSLWRGRQEALEFAETTAGALEGGRELAALELAKIDMYDRWPSFSLARYQRWRASRDASHWKKEDDLAGVSLRLAPYVQIWRDSKETAHLLQIEGAEVVDEPLTPLADAVLSCFVISGTINDASRAVNDMLGTEQPATEAVNGLVKRQVFAAIDAEIVESAADP